jgi:hypothetical protein
MPVSGYWTCGFCVNFTFPVSAFFIGTWAIGSEFADKFHRTDLLSMGDLRLTPEGNGF